MRQVKVALKNSGTTNTKCPQMKDKVAVIQRKQPGGAKKRPGITCMAEDNRRKAKHCSDVPDCRITGCNPAPFGAIRGTFVPSVVAQHQQTNRKFHSQTTGFC
jgi:hypothetical protein